MTTDCKHVTVGAGRDSVARRDEFPPPPVLNLQSPAGKGKIMTKVIATARMSLDGYIAKPGESGFDHLFRCYRNGDVAVPVGDRATHLRYRLRAT